MRRLAYLAAVAVMLALVPSAGAKAVTEVQVCGAARCVSVTDPAAVHMLVDDAGWASRVPVSAYYVLKMIVEHEGRRAEWETYYSPSAGAVRPADTRNALWRALKPEARALLEEVTSGLEPHAPPRLTRVLVGRRAVTDSRLDTYLRLFELGTPFYGVSRSPGWIPISLQSEVRTPWTDGAAQLAYSPRQRLLRVYGWRFRLSRELVARLARADALE